jgi:hypothetical protein
VFFKGFILLPILAHKSSDRILPIRLTPITWFVFKLVRLLLACLLGLLVWGFLTAGPAAAALNCTERTVSIVPIKIEKLAPDVWLIPAVTGESDASNLGLTSHLVVVRAGPRTWLVGSGPSPAIATAVQCQLRKQLGLFVTDVLNPRAYAEVTLGNRAFTTRRVWSHQEVAQQMRLRCPRCVERLSARLTGASTSALPLSTDARIPNQLFSGAHGLLGPFEWWRVERAKNEPVVLLRHRFSGVFISSGLVWSDITPDLRDADLSAMLKNLAWLEQKNPTMLVPEQGPMADSKTIARQLAYWTELQRQVQTELAKANPVVSPDQLASLSSKSNWPLFKERHGLNLQRAWRQLEDASLR